MKQPDKGNMILFLSVLGIAACICMVSLSFYKEKEVQDKIPNVEERIQADADESGTDDGSAENETIEEEVPITIDIREHYLTNIGDASNLYYIDENKVLWGSGRNEFGQLGQGTQDNDFHEELVKIAENVIHVDYSQKGFVIYITEDYKLYGFGNAGCGALQQFEQLYWEQYVNDEHYTVTTPILLMEDVAYARCGQNDVVSLAANGDVWIWGTVAAAFGWNPSPDTAMEEYYIPKPVKVLENAVYVTGGWYNHAALLADGSVYTWGHNYTGNCGIEGESVVLRPMKAAEETVMVWTGGAEQIDCQDITEIEEYERYKENTIIQKRDGSLWACGVGMGTEEKNIPIYYEAADIFIICTHEFLPYEDL